MNSHQPTILILGGGVGGVVAARTLQVRAGGRARIVVIDKSPLHVYAPGFLHLMLAKRAGESLTRPLQRLARKGVEVVQEEVVKIEPEQRTVLTTAREHFFDYLVIALGAEFAVERILGLKENGFNLYERRSVERLRDALGAFSGGKLAIVITALPFKCPAAPYEAAFLLDEYFQNKKLRHRTEIHIYTPELLPLPAAGTDIGRRVREMLKAGHIEFHPETILQSVDAGKKELVLNGGPPAPFDLLVYVPPHQGPKAVRASGMGNEAGYLPVDRATLQTKYDRIYAIGDCTFIPFVTGKPLPKAGVFAHFEAEVVARNIAAELRGEKPRAVYDGRAYCFLETGWRKAGFASGNFYADPAPKVTMRAPSRFLYMGKQLFEKYWWWKWF